MAESDVEKLTKALLDYAELFEAHSNRLFKIQENAIIAIELLMKADISNSIHFQQISALLQSISSSDTVIEETKNEMISKET